MELCKHRWQISKLNVYITDIERWQNAHATTHNAIVTHEVPLLGIWLFTDHKCKQNAPTFLAAVLRFTHAYLHTQTAVHRNLTN